MVKIVFQYLQNHSSVDLRKTSRQVLLVRQVMEIQRINILMHVVYQNFFASNMVGMRCQYVLFGLLDLMQEVLMFC